MVLQNCKRLLIQGLTADEAGNKQLAFHYYKEAVEATSIAIGQVQKPGLKEKLEIILKQALERAEELKKLIHNDRGFAESSRETKSAPKLFRGNSVSLKVSGKHQYTDSEKKVLLATSKINNIDFLPFMESIDDKEKFFIGLDGSFLDKYGTLQLAPKQVEQFYKWVRPSHLYDNPVMIFGDEIDYVSIKQTIISDCSFVASLSVAALYERKFKRRLITNKIYPRKTSTKQPIYNPSGKYMIKLMLNGIKRKIIIDDRLPIDKYNNLLSSFSTRKGEMWISLLEKAYMKVMGGYDFPGSNSNIDLHALTGWIPQRISIKKDDRDFDADAIFQMLLKEMGRGNVLGTVATPDMSEAEAERAGLVPLHAYAILDIIQIDGAKLVKLKNPWSHVRWKGNYSEYDVTHWTEDLCHTLNYDPKKAAHFDNGIFWIDYKSLIHFFDVFYINWNPDIFAYTYCIHQAWSAGVGPAKDCYTIGENPQFRLKIEPQTTGSIWILLSRHITDIDDFKCNKEYITVLVYVTEGRKVYYPSDPAPFLDGLRINSPHYLVKIDLEKTKQRTFTLVLSQYEKTKTIFYTLRAYSTCTFLLEPIVEGYLYKKEITNGEWKGRTAGGCRNHPSYVNNPKYVLNVISVGKICIDLKAPAKIGIGFEIYPEENISAELKSTGPYRHGFVVLEMENVNAGKYIVVPSTFYPNEEARFFLTVKSTSPIDFSLKHD